MPTSLMLSNNRIPIDSLSAYIQQVNSIPLLSEEEEYQLATDYVKTQNVESARKLVLPHLRFVVKIARKYAGYGLAEADLIQEGNIGLMKAVKRFNPDHGVRLVSFAIHWIKAEIHEFIIRNWRIVKVATTKAQRKLFFNLRSMKNKLAWCKDSEVNKIATELNVSESVVQEMEQRLSAQDESFDKFMQEDDSNHFAPAQFLADPNSNPEALLGDADSEQDSKTRLLEALAQLDEREQDILQHRWLAEEKLTLHDLAAKYNVSAERIRQLEKQAMLKLRKLMGERE